MKVRMILIHKVFTRCYDHKTKVTQDVDIRTYKTENRFRSNLKYHKEQTDLVNKNAHYQYTPHHWGHTKEWLEIYDENHKLIETYDPEGLSTKESKANES